MFCGKLVGVLKRGIFGGQQLGTSHSACWICFLLGKIGIREKGKKVPMTHGFPVSSDNSDFQRWSRVRLRENKKNAWLKEENQKSLGLEEHRIHFKTSHCDNNNNEKHLLKTMAHALFSVFCIILLLIATVSYLTLLISLQLMYSLFHVYYSVAFSWLPPQL